MQRLDGKGLIIFAGKGGVGKTTCSAAVALHYAKKGQKTLLVTVDPAMRLEDSLGVPLTSRESLVVPNLWASMLDPEEIIRDKLAEYPDGEQVMEHPLFRYVSNYLPGLNELMAIGKLNELRHDADYDIVVVDTAPTGHALSFLSAPRAMQEIMSEKSVLRWAMRGYSLWMKVNKASRGLSRFFGPRQDTKPHTEGDSDEGRSTAEAESDPKSERGNSMRAGETVDIEAVFQDLAQEALEIQTMLTDQERTSLNIVTLPEKLPVEETLDLYEQAVKEIGIPLGYVIVNKVQPDALGEWDEPFRRLLEDEPTRAALMERLGKGGYPKELLGAMTEATEFSDLRLQMNLMHIEDLMTRLPDAEHLLIPLFKKDVAGLEALNRFQVVMSRMAAENASLLP